MRKKQLRYVILAVIAGSTMMMPAMADDSGNASSSQPYSILVDAKAHTMEIVTGTKKISTNVDEAFETRENKETITKPTNAAGEMSVNVGESHTDHGTVEDWGPTMGMVTERKDVEGNYLGLVNGTTNRAYAVNYNVNGANANRNVVEVFSGNNQDEIAAVQGAKNAEENVVILRNVGSINTVSGVVLYNNKFNEVGKATKNTVFVAGGQDIGGITSALAYDEKSSSGSLENNLVVLASGTARIASGAGASVSSSGPMTPQNIKTTEVIGNRVLLGIDSADTDNGKIYENANRVDSNELKKRMGKSEADTIVPAKIAQIIGGASETNKVNKNIVIIGEGSVIGKGLLKVNDETSKHHVNGIDTNSFKQDVSEAEQADNNYIIGGVSDVEATGNIIDINNAKALASGKVAIWGGHYFSDNATGDIKTGNTLNLNRVKGITLSRLANFENYNFDLPKDVMNGDTILTVTDPNGTDVSNTKINVGVSGEAPVLHKGDAIKLIYNTNGVTTTGAQYGKLQQGASLAYDITAKAGDDAKSVVAVVKDPSTENTVTPTPTPPSTGDTTNPVAPSTGDTAGTTPSVGGTTGTTPAETNTNLSKSYSILVDAKAHTMETVTERKKISANVDESFETRGNKETITKPTNVAGEMSVNVGESHTDHGTVEDWGPKVGVITDGKNAEGNYLGLVNGTTNRAYAVYYAGNPANAKYNTVEVFSGNSQDDIAAVHGAKNAEENVVIVRNAGTIATVNGAVVYDKDGRAAKNTVFVAGGQDIGGIAGAVAFNQYSSNGSLKDNLVVLASGTSRTAFGAMATVIGDENSPMTPKNRINAEVIGNRVLLGIDSADTEHGKIYQDSARVDSHELKKRMGKSESDSIIAPKVGQVIGGFSKTNKANKNVIVIGEGSIAGKGLFKVKNEQSKHHVNGIDTNGVIPEAMEDSKQAGNNFIIGGVSDAEATGNIVDINNAKALASGKVAIWGGHYFSDNATGDIKTGNTLNLNKVKGITLSHLANFENYNFDLPKDIVNGDTVLTVTDSNGTDVSNTKINVGVSGEAPTLHKGDTIKLIYNTNGVTTTGAQYGKLQQGASFSYDISAKAGDDNKSVVAVVNSAPVEGMPATVLPQTKSFVETRAAVSSVINDGQGSMEKAFANTSSTSPIVAGMGHGNMRVESGSYVNIKGTNIVLGLGKQSGKTYWGPFVEMGWSRYDSHLDSGLRADGNAKYYGIGVYGKTTYDNGIYLEGSIRGGRTSYNYESNEIKTATKTVHTSYDAHNMYYGAHLGLGKVMSYGNGYEGTVYANLFYSHQGEATATLKGEGLGETYTFAGVNSLRTRLGYKVSKQLGNNYTGYVGAAYEREFSGEAHATVKGASTLAPSLGGSSGLVEVGVTYGSTADAFTGTLNVEGWFGQKRGTTFGGRVNWKY